MPTQFHIADDDILTVNVTEEEADMFIIKEEPRKAREEIDNLESEEIEPIQEESTAQIYDNPMTESLKRRKRKSQARKAKKAAEQQQ